MGCFAHQVRLASDVEYLAKDQEQVRPSRAKKVTDCKFIVLFPAVLITLGFLSYYVLSRSYPDIFVHGVDSKGNICGKKKNLDLSKTEIEVEDYSQRNLEFHFKSAEAGSTFNLVNLMQRSPEDTVICVKVSDV